MASKKVEKNGRKETKNLELVGQFSKDIFDNAQDLIRLLDTKSNYLMVIAGIMVSGSLVLAKPFFDSSPPLLSRAIAFLLMGSFLYHIYFVVHGARMCLMPRPNSGKSDLVGLRGLIFPMMIRDHVSWSDSRLAQALVGLNANDLIKEYANQINQVSRIYIEKQRHLNESIASLESAAKVWIAIIAYMIGALCFNFFKCHCFLGGQ